MTVEMENLELELDVRTVKTTDENMFEIVGLDPKNNSYDFSINLNKEFGEALRSISVPENQEAASENLVDMFLDDLFASVRFYEDTFFLSGIQVGGQATGLDHYEEKREYHAYHTHNVDTAEQAIEIITVFNKWVELARHLLVSEIKDNND